MKKWNILAFCLAVGIASFALGRTAFFEEKDDILQDQIHQLFIMNVGLMDFDKAYMLELVEKVKLGSADTDSAVAIIKGFMVPIPSRPTLMGMTYDTLINNLIAELCLVDIGRASKTDLEQYLSMAQSPRGGPTNAILDIIRSEHLTPREAIGFLMVLKTIKRY